jgi:hypothetical protein
MGLFIWFFVLRELRAVGMKLLRPVNLYIFLLIPGNTILMQ